MEEDDRKILDKHATRFTTELELNIILPILIEVALWRETDIEELKVCSFVCFISYYTYFLKIDKLTF
jgi:hypothetical protein